MLYTCKGSVSDLSFSDWLNTYVYVTDCGDIRAGYARQLLNAFLDTHRRNKGVRQNTKECRILWNFCLKFNFR